ncbi:hypothetical protein AVEN_263906-1 [Araneus ventricosus]|uniref:Uncharacterized protein n=1 Tax=Araneus ventricosus TaxID=182803 RepID=A0A4Y2VM94_ARAVE|nr:hypothetical protein AVEN_263906-1 [Araneus ventricosus]
MGLSLQHLMRYQVKGVISCTVSLQRTKCGFIISHLRRRKHHCHGDKTMRRTPHKKLKRKSSAKKGMTTVFCDNQGLLLVYFHTRGATVNAASYYASLHQLS